MKVTIFVQVIGKINSKELFEIVEQFGMNVTDMGDKTLVYGECYLEQASRIVFHCSLFGNTMTEITH